MYGLPSDFAGSFLIGKELEQVCFNSNQIVFNFSESVKIIAGSLYFFDKGDSLTLEERLSIPVKNSNLMLLIGEKTKDLRWNREGTLTLIFEKGQSLSIYDDSKQYESYEIHNGSNTIVV